MAKLLGRSPSTVSREMSRNGGYDRYRATLADENAWARARRPKYCKLADNPRLRPVDAFWSIIVYDATGHLQKNRYDAYSLNIAPPPGGEIYGHLDARDPVTGDKKWEVRFPEPPLASVLSTAGNLVFVPDSRGVIHAYDAETGTELWNHSDGTGHQGGIISYAVGGRQYIALTAGFGGMAIGRLRANIRRRLQD